MDAPLLWAGMLACAGAAAGALVLSDRRRAAALMLAALALAPILVVGDNWDTQRLAELRDRPALAAAAGAVALIALAALAKLFAARPALVPLLALAALPFRIPVGLGEDPANLLLPLYAVIAAGALAALIRPAERPPAAPDPRPLRYLAPMLAAVMVVYALQAGYADDTSPAGENVAFFLVPFAALFLLLRDVEWSRGLLRAAAAVLVVEALLFAFVGFGQYAIGELFWNEKVIEGNEAHAWFRVNSLFWDPNIMGRYLMVLMLGVATALAWARGPRTTPLASALFVVLLLAAAITFSQSSLIGLIAGLIALGFARFGIGIGLGLTALALVGMAAAWLLFAGGPIEVETSGRESLIDGGIELAEERPLSGHGSGSFSAVFREQYGGAGGVAVASHTEPITVAAEQGAIGSVFYVALMIVAFWLAAVRVRAGTGATAPIAAGLFAAFVAMFVHSLGYAAFFTDPITWTLLALLASRSLEPQ